VTSKRIERVLSIDPGKLTGLAHMVRTDDTVDLLATMELDEDTVIPWVRPIIEDWRPTRDGEYPLRVVMETFTITLETAKKSQSPFSLEVIGAVKQVCRDNGYPLSAIAWQKPSEAKESFPNPKLKRLGLWHRGGAGHALDAIRHGSLYLARSGWTDSRFFVD
jgi:hypothetical protein